MTVYVDNARIPWKFGWRMSHMLADSQEELDEMAETIGLNPKWYQPDRYGGHYDVTQSMRALAIQNGATAIDIHELATLLPKLAVAYRNRGGDKKT